DSGEVVMLFPNHTQTCGVADVERLNPYSFYELSKTLKALAAHTEQTPANACFFELITASGTLGHLLKGNPIQLGVSRSSAEALEKCVDGILNDHLLERDTDGALKYREEPKV